MTMSKLEQSLIENARQHREALAAYYPKHQAGRADGDAHAEYLKHSGALNNLVSLTHYDSGLSQVASNQLREIEAQDVATFKLHFPVSPAPAESIVEQATTHVFLKDAQ